MTLKCWVYKCNYNLCSPSLALTYIFNMVCAVSVVLFSGLRRRLKLCNCVRDEWSKVFNWECVTVTSQGVKIQQLVRITGLSSSPLPQITFSSESTLELDM